MCYVYNQWYDISCATLYVTYALSSCPSVVVTLKSNGIDFNVLNPFIFQILIAVYLIYIVHVIYPS